MSNAMKRGFKISQFYSLIGFSGNTNTRMSIPHQPGKVIHKLRS